MNIIIFDKVDDLQKYCAKLFIEQIKKNPYVKLGFATGVSPVPAYKYLIKDHQKNHTSWKNVTTFNLDEFVGIKKTHKEAFIEQMKTNLFNYVDIDFSKVNIPNAETSNPEKEVELYENKIQESGGIDFQYISLGINGHMAYNEPGTNFNSSTHIAKLTTQTIEDMVQKGKFASIEESPKYAMTMGIQTILKHTKEVIMISFGQHKALVTKQMLEDTPNNTVTASYLQLHPNCTYLLDTSAASLLSHETLKMAKKG